MTGQRLLALHGPWARGLCAFVLALFVLTICDGEQTELPRALTATHDALNALRNATSADMVKEVSDQCKGAPVYSRLALAEALVPLLARQEIRETPGYEWQPRTHDLGQIAGRAAFLLEVIVDTELPHVEPTSSEADLAAIQRVALAAVAGYRAGIMAVATERNVGESTESLKKAYKGKITPGITQGAPGSATAMAELLDRWFPIGKKIDDLAELVGSPGEKRNDGIAYRFDTGYGGSEFLFVVEDGVIVSVRISGLY